MRGNSGFLRWVTFFNFIILLTPAVIGGPARHRRMMREIYANHDAQTFLNDTQTTDTCNWNGKEVIKSSVVCDKKPGCRAIQTYGACCPEYQCDCKQGDKLYENGEKLVDPDTPCRVCICRGGEINCNYVTCYNRNDCKPKFIAGRCCPEYDNCPPLENVKLGNSKESDITEEKYSIKSTRTPYVSEEISTSTVQAEAKQVDVKQPLPDNPLGIKIKEITKPEEIRITDNRPKVYKPIKSNESISSKSLLSSSTSANDQSQENEPSSSPRFDESTPSNAFEITSEQSKSIEDTISINDDDEIDLTLDADVEEPNQLDNDDANLVGDNSVGIKNVRQADNLTKDSNETDMTAISSEENLSYESELSLSSTTSNSNDFSSTSENLDEHSKAKSDPVVFVVDHRGQTKSIVVLDADGLQRGEDPYEDEGELKTNIRKSVEKVASPILNSGELINMNPSESTFDEVDSTAKPDFTLSETSGMQDDQQEMVFETVFYDHVTNGPMDLLSKEIFSDTLHTREPSSSEESIHIESEPSSSNPLEENDLLDLSTGVVIVDSITDKSSVASQKTYDTVFYTTKGPDDLHIYEPKYYTTDQMEGSSSPFDDVSLSSIEVSSSSPIFDKAFNPTSEISNRDAGNDDEEIDHNENPEFPMIPDDISIHGTKMAEDDHEQKHRNVPKEQTYERSSGIAKTDSNKPSFKILLDVLPLRSNASTTENSLFSLSSTVPEGWLKLITNTTKLHRVTDTDISNTSSFRSPGEPLLVPEWERNSTELMSLESFNISTENSFDNDNTSDEDSSHQLDNKISTSSISSTTSNLDELSSASDENEAHNPNEDVESIKYEAGDRQFIETPKLNIIMDVARDILSYQNRIWK